MNVVEALEPIEELRTLVKQKDLIIESKDLVIEAQAGEIRNLERSIQSMEAFFELRGQTLNEVFSIIAEAAQLDTEILDNKKTIQIVKGAVK